MGGPAKLHHSSGETRPTLVMRRETCIGFPLITLLTQLACSPASNPNGDRPPREARRARFGGALLLPEGAPRAPSRASLCDLPIRPVALELGEAPPEANLTLSLELGPTNRLDSKTDERGRSSLVLGREGLQTIKLLSADLQYEGRIRFSAQSRRTELRGYLLDDASDLDGDGDTKEGLLVVDLIPDDDQDGIADFGGWSRYVFSQTSGLLFRHLSNGVTEQVELDARFEEQGIEIFDDLDGDLRPDEGDVLAAFRGGAPGLPCPGFSHDSLFTAGSKHEAFRCDKCHSADKNVAPLACQDCHHPSGRAMDKPETPTPASHFEARCELCHQADRPWAEVPGPNGSKHDQFPLLGKHLTLDCYRCHDAGRLDPPKKCESCHINDAAVDHYKTSCETCHSSEGWKPATAQHDQFPLAGGHADLACDQCHTPPEYTGLSPSCEGCHTEDRPQKHGTGRDLDTQPCGRCHEISGFQNYQYQHTQWLLEESHAEVQCEKCHEGVSYQGNDGTCVGCHVVPVFPAHDSFGEDCNGCHTPARWAPATQGSFDHAVFPLENAHADATCGSCHEDGARPRPPQDCASCHVSDRPSRHLGVFEGACDTCHTTAGWASLDPPYEHTATFALVGRHAETQCSSCHTTSYQAASTACVSCHLADEPPDHYGSDCAGCHEPTSWRPTGDLDHHAVDPAAFPLTFGHATLRCTDCHSGGFNTLSTDCRSCHENDLPLGHATTSCESCHESGRWQPSVAPPPNRFHPLTGGHAARACTGCHGAYQASGQFTTPEPDVACATCHPLPVDHPLQVGSSPCETCHGISGWVPAAGGHVGPMPTTPFPYLSWSQSWFPDGVSNGKHKDANQCNKCHVQSGTYSFFSCTTLCHKDRREHDSEHKNGVDEGSEPKKQFHLYHYLPTDQNVPPDEGGALWPSGHVGCVNRSCHPTGRKP